MSLGRRRQVSLDITDSEPVPLKIDVPVEMTIRRRYVDKGHGIPGYFGKVEPVSA